MVTIRAFVGITLAFGFLLAGHCVCAQDDEFSIQLGLEARQVENANRQPKGEEQIDELQQDGVLSALGSLAGSYYNAQVDYTLEARRFSEQPEQDSQLLLGRASLYWGSKTSRFYALIKHSSDEVLIDPGQGDSPGNLDSRTITSGATFVRFGKPISQLRLGVIASEVRFDSNELIGSERQGVELYFDRQINPLNRFSVVLTGYSLEYPGDNTLTGIDSAYDYRKAAIQWDTRLRKLNYNLIIGSNQVERDETVTSPFYEFSLGYDDVTNQFDFELRQWLTDSSQGSGNSEGFTDVSQDGRIDTVDQLRRRDASVRWMNRGICSRCVVAIALGAQKERYQRASQFDITESFGQLNFQYQPRRRVQLEFKYRLQQASYEEGVEPNYDETRISAVVSIDEIFKRGKASMFIASQERVFSSRSQPGYETSQIGLSFNYAIYQR